MERVAFEELVAEVAAKLRVRVDQIDVDPVLGWRAGPYFDRGRLHVTPAWVEVMDYSEQVFLLAYYLRMGRMCGWWLTWLATGVSGSVALAGSAYFAMAMHLAWWSVVLAIPLALLSTAIYSTAILVPIKGIARRVSIRRALEVSGSLQTAESGMEKRYRFDLRGEHPVPKTYNLDPSKELQLLRKIAGRMRPRLEN